MSRKVGKLFLGGEYAPEPRQDLPDEINQTINEIDPNEIDRKWSDLSEFSSNLVKKVVQENSTKLERIEIQNPWGATSQEISENLQNNPQLDRPASELQKIPESSPTTTTTPGSGKYATVRPFYPESSMWLRSYEENRKRDFS